MITFIVKRYFVFKYIFFILSLNLDGNSMALEGWQPSNHIVTTISLGLWSNVKRDVKLH